jgi:ankyrin repeat protein
MFIYTGERPYNAIYATRPLVQSGVDVNASDEYGYTPLLFAIVTSRVEVTKCLLELGSEIPTNDMGASLVRMALRKKSLRTLSELLHVGADTLSCGQGGFCTNTLSCVPGQLGCL